MGRNYNLEEFIPTGLPPVPTNSRPKSKNIQNLGDLTPEQARALEERLAKTFKFEPVGGNAPDYVGSIEVGEEALRKVAGYVCSDHFELINCKDSSLKNNHRALKRLYNIITQQGAS